MTGQPVDLLRTVSLFNKLPEADLVKLAGHLRQRHFHRNTILFHKDQPGDSLYIVESGHIRIFLPTATGEELTVEIAGPGDVVGELALLDGRPRSASVQTLEDTVVRILGRDDFQQYLTTAPNLAASLLELLSTRLRQITEYAESLAFLDIHGRVAWALLQLAGKHGVDHQGVEIDFDMTQTELASMVGATRERVNRALASFRTQGLVEIRGKKIAILDSAKLRQRIY